MQRLTVKHTTEYRYATPVALGVHRLMIRPRDSHDLRLLSASLTIQPNAQLRWLHDVFGNSVAVASFTERSDLLKIESQIVVDRYPNAGIEFSIEAYASMLPFSYPASEIPDLGRTIERHFPDPDRLVTEWTRSVLDVTGAQNDTEEFLRTLTLTIQDQFIYRAREEPGVQDPVETLRTKSGSCRDFAVLMMEAVRSVGLASRFVSGYLYDPTLDGDDRSASKVKGAGATHAWVQVYLPGAGWIEFDPTNGIAGGRNLVPIAVAREPNQAMPISGTFHGPANAYTGMSVEVSVESSRLLENVVSLQTQNR